MTSKGMKKVSYNPFKMWGSWVGLLVYLSGFIFFIGDTPRSNLPFPYSILDLPLNAVASLIEFLIGTHFNFLVYILGIVFNPLVFGFLIGWAIHSLVRYLRNE